MSEKTRTEAVKVAATIYAAFIPVSTGTRTFTPVDIIEFAKEIDEYIRTNRKVE